MFGSNDFQVHFTCKAIELGGPKSPSAPDGLALGIREAAGAIRHHALAWTMLRGSGVAPTWNISHMYIYI